MIEDKKAGLNVYVAQTKLTDGVSVGVSFPLRVNGCALNRLSGGAGCSVDCFPAGAEEAALGYSMCLVARQILCGSPQAVLKSKVTDLTCVAHSGSFGINWRVKGTGSAVRKSIGLVLKVLNPVRMWPVYSKCVKQLGGSADKAAFLYVADAAQKAIKSSLSVGIVGRIALDKPHLTQMLEVLEKKHDPKPVPDTKMAPSKHTACDHSECTEIKSSGWGTAVLADYIRERVRGLVPQTYPDYLLVAVKPAQWSTLASKLKKGVKDYVAKSYLKVPSDDLAALFGYGALANGSLCAADVKVALNSKLTTAALEAAIQKGL